MLVSNIVVGVPIVPLEVLLSDERNKYDDWKSVTVYEKDRYIPNLLVKYKFISSIRELKRNRPDLDKFYDPNELDFLEIKIGKKKVCIVIGEG